MNIEQTCTRVSCLLVVVVVVDVVNIAGDIPEKPTDDDDVDAFFLCRSGNKCKLYISACKIRTAHSLLAYGLKLPVWWCCCDDVIVEKTLSRRAAAAAKPYRSTTR